MMAERGRLTRGHVSLLIRVSGLVGITFALAGILLLLVPLPEAPALQDIAKATTRRFVDHTFLFPKYSELTDTRASPFEFQELARTKVPLRKIKPKPPPPKPDVVGLTLVGTAPGNSGAQAVLFDEKSGKITHLERGDEIRNSVVKDIIAEKIVFVLDTEQAELQLADVRGSENLSRQLQGLAPLPEQPATKNNQAGYKPPPSSSANQSSGNAILVGASNAGRMSNTVVTQPISTSRPQQQQSSASNQPGSTPTPGSGSTGSATPRSGSSSQDTAAGQSGNESMQDQSPSSSQPEPQSDRSLGISGYMLSLEKQQELGLQETGLLVTSIRTNNSPIKTDDVILAISGQSFDSLAKAKQIIQTVKGNTVQLRVFRNGASTQVNAPLI